MKKSLLVGVVLASTVLLSSCGTQAPLNEAQQAEKYNMTTQEYKEMKDAAARMNMTIEEHMNMWDMSYWVDHSTMDHSNMGDDSFMIEDDLDMMDISEDNDSEENM